MWGLIDKRGENIVEAKFSQIEIWNAEIKLLLVVKNGKYGIMNQHGIYVLKCKYDFIGHIDSDGYAEIILDGKTGRIDSDCHFIEETSIVVGNSYMKVKVLTSDSNGVLSTSVSRGVIAGTPVYYNQNGYYDENGVWRKSILKNT